MTSVQRLTSLTLRAVGKISLGGIFRSRLEFFFAIRKAAFSSERYWGLCKRSMIELLQKIVAINYFFQSAPP